MSQPKSKSASRRRSRSGLIRYAVIGAVVLVLLLGLWVWQRGDARGTQEAWRTVPVERGDIRVVISATGTLSATSTVVIGSQISGQVIDVMVDFNDQVSQGQVLATIDPSTYQAQIEQGNAQIASARASLAQAQATLRNAELDYRRKSELVDRQLVARSDVDLARAALDQAQAQVRSAQAQIAQQTASTRTTQVNLDRTVIRSPVNGVVLTRTIEPGQTVAASLQAPELFTIAEDLSKMQIELAVDESDIGQVREGQVVSFAVDAFPDRQFRGVVSQVRLAATTTSNVVTYPVVVAVDNADGTLLPGLTVNAEIRVSDRQGVLKVSNAALRYRPSGGNGVSPAASGPRTGGGITTDLAAVAAELELSPQQQAAFDTAVAAVEQRQSERRPQAREGGGSGGPPMMMGAPGGNNADIQAQVRQRMAERFRQDFSGFRETLDPSQRERWDAALGGLVNARRVTVYRLVDGAPQPVMVRLGVSDGTSTEIAGTVAEGDLLVSGERVAR